MISIHEIRRCHNLKYIEYYLEGGDLVLKKLVINYELYRFKIIIAHILEESINKVVDKNSRVFATYSPAPARLAYILKEGL